MDDSLQSRVVVLDNAVHHGSGRPADPSIILWHATEGDSARSSIDYLNTTKDKVASYAYVIDRDGLIYRMTHPGLIAYHAGDSWWPNPKVATSQNPDHPNGRSINTFSLGIAFANKGDGEALTLEQRASGLWLGKVYINKYGILIGLNLGHYEVSPGRKTDPKPAVDMNDWRASLTEYLAR